MPFRNCLRQGSFNFNWCASWLLAGYFFNYLSLYSAWPLGKKWLCSRLTLVSFVQVISGTDPVCIRAKLRTALPRAPEKQLVRSLMRTKISVKLVENRKQHWEFQGYYLMVLASLLGFFIWFDNDKKITSMWLAMKKYFYLTLTAYYCSMMLLFFTHLLQGFSVTLKLHSWYYIEFLFSYIKFTIAIWCGYSSHILCSYASEIKCFSFLHE